LLVKLLVLMDFMVQLKARLVQVVILVLDMFKLIFHLFKQN